MRGVPLAQCIANASKTRFGAAPLPVPRTKNIFPVCAPNFTYYYTNILTSEIYVIGHSGLTRNGENTALNGKYPSPANIQ